MTISCESCPAISRRQEEFTKISRVDATLHNYMYHNDPTFDVVCTDQASEILTELGVPERSHEDIFKCARQRFMGMCALGIEDVKTNPGLI